MNHWESCNEGKKCLVSAHRCCGGSLPAQEPPLPRWRQEWDAPQRPASTGGGGVGGCLPWNGGGVQDKLGSPWRETVGPSRLHAGRDLCCPLTCTRSHESFYFFIFLINVQIFSCSAFPNSSNWKLKHNQSSPPAPRTAKTYAVQHASAGTTHPLWILRFKPIVSDVANSHALFLNIHFMLGFKPRYLRVLSPVLQS